MQTDPLTVRKRPCPSCPYRRDAPSGMWNEAEYDKLPRFDGDTTAQAMAGALGAFFCHTSPDLLCAGWVGCHDMAESMGLRMQCIVSRRPVDPAVYSYTSPVPLFVSGAEAAAHGKRDLAAPDARTRRHQLALLRKIGRRP